MITATTMMMTINRATPPATDITTINVKFDFSPTHMSNDSELHACLVAQPEKYPRENSA